jgi:hypothetical protein
MFYYWQDTLQETFSIQLEIKHSDSGQKSGMETNFWVIQVLAVYETRDQEREGTIYIGNLNEEKRE